MEEENERQERKNGLIEDMTVRREKTRDINEWREDTKRAR